VFYKEKYISIKTRDDLLCCNLYSSVVVTQDLRIGSWANICTCCGHSKFQAKTVLNKNVLTYVGKGKSQIDKRCLQIEDSFVCKVCHLFLRCHRRRRRGRGRHRPRRRGLLPTISYFNIWYCRSAWSKKLRN
jgi:hypothetical protein